MLGAVDDGEVLADGDDREDDVDGRPEVCSCVAFREAATFPCFPCWIAGFDEPTATDEESGA